MSTDTPSRPGADGPAYPLPVARIARLLGADRRTLWRALRNDPGAPDPAERNDLGHPLYNLPEVTAWWPTRRAVGRPGTPTARTASPGIGTPGEAPND